MAANRKMKVELPSSGFIIKQGIIAGETVYLVTPEQMGIVWSKENAIFRSSIWSAQGEPVSLSFRKFTNLTEKLNVFPDPADISDAQLIEKIDGSALIVSKYKGELIVRTRGTFDARTLDTGYEIDILKKKYPKAFDNTRVNNEHYTLIFEWVGKQKIVIDYGPEPDIILIGCVFHPNYSYLKQSVLDVVGKEIGVRRPKTYKFDTLENAVTSIKETKGVEGICLYFNHGQDIKKIKSSEYLLLHSVRSNLTAKTLAELFFSWDEPGYMEFCEKFENTYDYECLTYAQDAIQVFFEGVEKYKSALIFLYGNYIAKKDISRKDYAIAMLKTFGKTKEFNILMNMYANKKTDIRVLTELLLEHTQEIKLGMFSPKK